MCGRVQTVFIDICLTFTSVLLQPSDRKHSTSIFLIRSGCLSDIAPPTFNLSRDLITQNASECGFPGLFSNQHTRTKTMKVRSPRSVVMNQNTFERFCEVGGKQTWLSNKTELTFERIRTVVNVVSYTCVFRTSAVNNREQHVVFSGKRDAIQDIQLKVSQYFVCSTKSSSESKKRRLLTVFLKQWRVEIMHSSNLCFLFSTMSNHIAAPECRTISQVVPMFWSH